MLRHEINSYSNGIVISLKNKEMVHVHLVFVLVSRYGLFRPLRVNALLNVAICWKPLRALGPNPGLPKAEPPASPGQASYP